MTPEREQSIRAIDPKPWVIVELLEELDAVRASNAMWFEEAKKAYAEVER